MANFVKIPPLTIWGASEWKLFDDLIYQSDRWPEEILVPKDTVTDLASIPRIFRGVLPQNGKHRAPAIVHDYLVTADGFDRALADRIFLEAMEVAEVRRWRRLVMYWAVSIQTLYLKAGRRS